MPDDDDLLPDLFEVVISAAATGGVGALPVLFRRAWPAVRRERARNTSRCIEAAVSASGLSSREDLAEVLMEDPESINLTVRALHNAGMTGADEALLTMGAALGSAVNVDSPTSTSTAALIVEAARNLTSGHVRLMRHLTEPHPRGETVGWSRSEVSQALDIGLVETEMLVASCEAGGVVFAQPAIGSAVYETSTLGLEVLRLLDTLRHQF